ncbi:extracellular solute-binding protein [Gracilibacillus salitolerans]|uniref:Extracellular solute-binding protein n=2 Tax=Gracilibacillus salitolerans TaxID=2663022 RepID=A0A5Q2TW61_9BACI|nr:extracellular solute-binding protein [Gracilibacillus salitolerans]QGH37038.1 extracellular solute-binding protein [Gracilibacillus salitolerans]
MLLMLTTLMFLVTIACSENNSESSNNDGSQSDEPFEFSMIVGLHTSEVPEERVQNKIEELTNTNIDIQWIPASNYYDRLNSAFATNSLPDVINVGSQEINQFRDAIEDDRFWEVGPYIEEYENLSKLKENVIENTLINGKVYGLYTGIPLSRQGYIYRKDWADNLGIDAPTSTEEFMEMARAFTEDDPDGNGEDDTMGLADRGDLIYGAFKTVSSWFGTPNYWGQNNGQLLPEFMFDEYMQTMDYLKEMHSKGYVNQDFPVTSKTDQQEMFKNGTAGIYVGAMGDVGSLYNDAIAINPELEYDVNNYVEGPDGEFGVWSLPGYGSVMMFPKSSVESEEELKNILAFFDKMMTSEVANIANWGFEGEHYEIVDGKAKLVDDALFEREVKPYNALLIGEEETRGSYESLMEYEVKVKSEELIKDNENYLIVNPTEPLYSKTFVQDSTRLQQIITDATYQYILGQIDKEEFEAAVEDWLSQGGNEIIKEYNAAWQETTS